MCNPKDSKSAHSLFPTVFRGTCGSDLVVFVPQDPLPRCLKKGGERSITTLTDKHTKRSISTDSIAWSFLQPTLRNIGSAACGKQNHKREPQFRKVGCRKRMNGITLTARAKPGQNQWTNSRKHIHTLHTTTHTGPQPPTLIPHSSTTHPQPCTQIVHSRTSQNNRSKNHLSALSPRLTTTTTTLYTYNKKERLV